VQTSTAVGTNWGGPAESAGVAYLILRHKDHRQVMALADRIHELSPTSQIVVHHDRKADTQSDGNYKYNDLDAAQREVLAILTERLGPHSSWRPPVLPPLPAWVDDVLRLRRDYASAARELHWVKASRSYKMASSLWRMTGRHPRTLDKPNPEKENVP
jgi:hypothetical protein